MRKYNKESNNNKINTINSENNNANIDIPQIPRNITIIQQETPISSTTKKPRKSKKKQKLNNQTSTLETASTLTTATSTNIQQPTTLQQYLIFLTQTFSLQIQPKLNNQSHPLHPTQPNYFNKKDEREC